jgi:FkbH-like protein
LNLFETRTIPKKDIDRTALYKAEFERVKMKVKYSSIDDYLKSLHMIASINPFILDDAERISQLSFRSNQFNLRTIRYSKDEIINIINSSSHLTFSVRLKDKFGDHGLVAIAIVKIINNKHAFLDSLLMSCRVLKRGVESFLMNKIIDKLNNLSVNLLIGEYLPTNKNILVKNFLTDHQFKSFTELGQNSIQVVKFKTIKNSINESSN